MAKSRVSYLQLLYNTIFTRTVSFLYLLRQQCPRDEVDMHEYAFSEWKALGVQPYSRDDRSGYPLRSIPLLDLTARPSAGGPLLSRLADAAPTIHPQLTLSYEHRCASLSSRQLTAS